MNTFQKIANSIIQSFTGKNGFIYLFVLMTFAVVINSWFDPFGGITLDAPWYLHLSESLASGNGFNTLPPDFIFYQEQHYTFLWPPLYPIMIAFVAKISSLPVWFAYKLVNLFCLFFAFRRCYQYYGSKGWLICAFFFSAYMVDMAYQCWSELPLICFLVFYFIELDRIAQIPKPTFRQLLPAAILVLIMTGIRYQAVVASVGLLIILWKYIREKKYQEVKLLSSVIISILLLQIVFIYFNYYSHNKIVLDAPLDAPRLKELLATFAIQCLHQLNFLFCQSIRAYYLLPLSIATGYILFGNYIKSLRLNRLFNQKNIYLMAPAIVGIVYMLVALVMSKNNAIGLSHSRFYSVPIFCLIWSLIHIVTYQNLKRRKVIIIAFIFISLTINVVGKCIYINQVLEAPIFSERLSEYRKKYEKLPSGSMVAFADKWIEFIRPDVLSVSPYEKNMGTLSLPMDSFLQQVNLHRHSIYIEILDTANPRLQRYDPSVSDYMRKHEAEEILYIKSGN